MYFLPTRRVMTKMYSAEFVAVISGMCVECGLSKKYETGQDVCGEFHKRLKSYRIFIRPTDMIYK